MTDDKQRIEHAKWLFERTLGWIASADVKVGVAMALDTAMLGGLAVAFGSSALENRTTWAFLTCLAATGGLVVAVFCAAIAAIPRMLGPVSSNIFFARIAERSEGDYIDQLTNMSDQAFLTDLANQIHRNAQIATAKHVWVRKSLIWSFVAAIPWIAAVGLLVKS